MNKTITALVELQSIDDEIREFALQREELAGNLERLRGILSKMSGELDDKQQRLAEATGFHTEKRAELQADADRIVMAKAKLASVTRTKEYAAAQREMDNLRKKYSEDETELKRLAAAIEEYNEAIATEKGKLGELGGEMSREESASAERLVELDKQIAAIAARKSAVTGDLNKSLISRYNRVLKRREGKAVIEAVAGACSGCRMKLPPQQYILVQRGETLEACPSCQRFLFYVPVESDGTEEGAAASA